MWTRCLLCVCVYTRVFIRWKEGEFLLDKFGGTKLEGLVALAIAGRNGDHFLALHGSGPLEGHVAQATYANDAYPLGGPGTVIFERGIGRQSGAEQRGSCLDLQ